MAQEKQFQSQLPELLTSLFGSGKTTTKASSTANTAGLQGVYDKAMAPMDQQLYDNLIASIFQKAAGQVPTLTAALANATGGRTTGNSPLALALNEQNNAAARDAAAAILAQQNRQLEIAGQAAGGIASSTKSSTQTSQQKPPLNPLLTMGLGFLANQADKRGWLDKLGNKVGSLFGNDASTSFDPSPITMNNIDMGPELTRFGNFSGMDVGTGSALTSFAMPGFTEFGGADLGSLGSEFLNFRDMGIGADFDFDLFGAAGGGLGSVPDVGLDLNIGDWGAPDLISDDIWQSFSGLFADGGPVGSNPQPAMKQVLRPSYAPAINQTVFAYADGGMAMPHHSMAMPMPRGYGPHGNPLDPRIYIPDQVFGPADITSRATGYADGGTIRNRPNIGTPAPRMGMNVINGGGGSSSTSDSGAPRQQQRTRPAAGPMEGETVGNDLSPGITPEQQAMMDTDALNGFTQRDAMLGFFGQALAGLALAGINPGLAMAANATGVTKGPLGLGISLAKAGINSMGAGAPAMSRPVSSSGPITVTDLGPLDGGPSVQAGEFGGSGGANLGITAGGDSLSSDGLATDIGFDTGPALFADGGMVDDTDPDTIEGVSTVPGAGKAKFQPGEMIIPVDVVNSVGRAHFEKLIAAYHKPLRR